MVLEQILVTVVDLNF